MDPGQILLSPAMNVNGPSELEALSPSFLMNQQNVMQPILQNSLPSNQETLPVGMYQNNLSPIPLTLPVSQFVNHNMQVPFYPIPVYMTNQSTSNQTAPGTSIQYATGTTNQGQMPRMIPNLQNIYQKDNQTRTMLKVPKQMPQFPKVYANIPTHNKFEVLPQDEDPLNECESDLNESDLNEVINPAVAEGLMDISNHTQKQKWCNASPGTSDVRQSRKQEIRAHTKAQVEIPEQEIFNNQVMLQDLVLHSDHNPVIVEIGSKYPTGINERRDKFRTGNVNWDDLTAKLKDVNIRAVIEGEAEIDKKIEAFQDHLVCTAKEIVPFGPVGFSKRKKSLPPNWTSALLDILNLAWSQGKFPTVWKYAEAVMIPKGGKDLSKLENHRMISLLPVLGKVYERIVKKRLNFEIERRKLLKDIQCGFRRKRSTIDCLNCIKQDALYAMQNNWIMLLVMLDVEGAFNNIVHRQILSGLIEAGFKGSLIAFVEDYMKQRTIKVRVKGELSDVIVLLEAHMKGADKLFKIIKNKDGYLDDCDCKESCRIFLRESPDLEERRAFVSRGISPTSDLGICLIDIFEDYFETKEIFTNLLSKVPRDLLGKVRRNDSLSTITRQMVKLVPKSNSVIRQVSGGYSYKSGLRRSRLESPRSPEPFIIDEKDGEKLTPRDRISPAARRSSEGLDLS
ncbi:hypothetical protein QYM36_014546, partial [Artemia franciscana]